MQNIKKHNKKITNKEAQSGNNEWPKATEPVTGILEVSPAQWRDGGMGRSGNKD